MKRLHVSTACVATLSVKLECANQHGDLGYPPLPISAKRRRLRLTSHQITADDRSILMAMRVPGASPAEIARTLGRHRSTIIREIARNSTNHDGYDRPVLADS